MTTAERNLLDYIVVCISEFAGRNAMPMRDDLLEKDELNCRVFPDNPTIEWAVFIRNNRDREFVDISSSECNPDCKYVVVAGPVANDTVGLLLRQFSRGTIDAEYMRKEFAFGKLTNQVAFHTEKALLYLKKAGVIK